MDDSELKEKMQDFRLEAENGLTDTFERMSKCERYRIGKQWDEETLLRYEEKRKHALTIDLIHPIINQLTGVEIKNPRDIVVVNTKGSTKTKAKILSALAKDVLDTSYAHKEKSFFFENGTTTSAGWIGVEDDFSKDPFRGDLTIKQYDPFMVLPDPNRKVYDINDPKGGCKYVFIDQWLDKDQVKAQYPDKKTELEDVSYSSNGHRSSFSRIMSMMFKDYRAGISDDYRTSSLNSNEHDQSENNFRISTCWWKDYKPVVAVCRKNDPLDVKIFYKKDDIKKAKKLAEQLSDEFEIIEKDKYGTYLTIGVMNKTVMCGDILLKQTEDPFNGMHLFPLIPYNPYFVNGYQFGVINNLIGPQDHVNFSWSTELNLLKNLANTGWKITSAITSKVKDWLKIHGAEDGIIIDESEFGGKVEKLMPNQYSPGFANMTERGKQYMTEIASVRTENPETARDRVAKTVQLKQAASMTNTATIFANYDYSYEMLGRVLIEMIRINKYYSKDEILAIVDKQDVIDPQMLNDARQEVIQDYGIDLESLQAATPEEQALLVKAMKKIDEIAQFYAISRILKEIESLNKGRFGIKVAMAATAETFKQSKAIEVLELNEILLKSGHQPISRQQIIEAVDPPNKEAILMETAA